MKNVDEIILGVAIGFFAACALSCRKKPADEDCGRKRKEQICFPPCEKRKKQPCKCYYR